MSRTSPESAGFRGRALASFGGSETALLRKRESAQKPAPARARGVATMAPCLMAVFEPMKGVGMPDSTIKEIQAVEAELCCP